jgi:hypothetical protein
VIAAARPTNSPSVRIFGAADLLSLQRLAGNAAVARQIEARRAPADSPALDGRAGGLPAPLVGGIQALSGLDLSDVRVVRRSEMPHSLGALACASDRRIDLAAGEERHLPHEAWHVVQQRQGRVARTSYVGRTPINDDPALEREADLMGARAARTERFTPVARRRRHTRTSPTQLKSTIATAPVEANAPTPVRSLSNVFKPYFTAAGRAELYTFEGLGLIDPSTYAGKWNRAGTATAKIDPTSRADGSDRDNTVIGPYGHFGAMERAIFGRQRLGNTYDGGHLVEHTLMEAKDADVHGNIAPQENRNFNQGLMRGWEAVAESLMHAGTAFDYTVSVKYSQHSYVRTGQQLVTAGVLPDLSKRLASTDWSNLLAQVVTFSRWVPYRWTGKVVIAGQPINLAFAKGAHFRNLVADKHLAKAAVLDTTTSPRPALRRQNSGTLTGAFEGATETATGLIVIRGAPHPRLGGHARFKAKMYQPEPQDPASQPAATTTPAGVAPAVLAPDTAKTEILDQPLSVKALTSRLRRLDQVKNFDKSASENPHFKSLRVNLKADAAAKQKRKRGRRKGARSSVGDGPLLPNAKESHAFVVGLRKAMGDAGSKFLTPDAFIMAIKRSALSAPVRNKLLLLANDPKLVD